MLLLTYLSSIGLEYSNIRFRDYAHCSVGTLTRAFCPVLLTTPSSTWQVPGHTELCSSAQPLPLPVAGLTESVSLPGDERGVGLCQAVKLTASAFTAVHEFSVALDAIVRARTVTLVSPSSGCVFTEVLCKYGNILSLHWEKLYTSLYTWPTL